MTSVMVAAETRIVNLEKGQKEALVFSKRIQAQDAEYQGALRRVLILSSENLPQFYLDGQYRYVSEVPAMSLPAPLNKKIELGQNNNYSAGINFSYLLTDFGQNKKNIAGASEEAKAVEQSKIALELQVKLKISQLFLKLRFQASQMHALLDSWLLAKEQEKDMALRLKSGISSRLDYVKATKESQGFKLKLLQTQREFSESMQDWLIITGENAQQGEFDKVVPEELSAKWITPDHSLVKIQNYNWINEEIDLNPNHPQLLQLDSLKLSSAFKADGVTRSYFPRLQFQARSSIEYPNGPKPEQFQQNAIMLSLVMPIWDGNRRLEQKAAMEYAKLSYELQKENLNDELKGEVRKYKSRLNQLDQEAQVVRDGIKDAETLAQLTYKSYQNGRSQFLEVQSANLKVLEWKTQMDTLEYARSLTLVQLCYLGAKL